MEELQRKLIDLCDVIKDFPRLMLEKEERVQINKDNKKAEVIKVCAICLCIAFCIFVIAIAFSPTIDYINTNTVTQEIGCDVK